MQLGILLKKIDILYIFFPGQELFYYKAIYLGQYKTVEFTKITSWFLFCLLFRASWKTAAAR